MISSLTLRLLVMTHIVMLPSIYGMAQSQGSSKASGLEGTSWQLVKFQGSDEKTITPDDKSKYTIAFGRDGRASIRLDCNRGSGSYESRAPNQLEFGRFAVTLMMCPPGSLQNRIARDLGSVRSYVIKDGHLFLSLMADGGIYEFEPLGSPSYVSNESLFGKKWRLTEIRGAAVPTTKAYIELVGETKRFSGDGGCNRISGNFALDGQTLRFLQVISTRRACLDAATQQVETDFLKALEDVFMYKLEENVLRLYLGDRLLLTFRSDSNQPDGSNEQLVTGTVTYLQRRALPPNAIMRLSYWMFRGPTLRL